MAYRTETINRSVCRFVSEYAFVHAGYPLDAAAVLLVETDGTPLEVADENNAYVHSKSGKSYRLTPDEAASAAGLVANVTSAC